MMPRPAPTITPREIITRGWLEPSGGHELEIAVPGAIVGMRLGFDQVNQLERAIAEWKRQVLFADGRGEIYNRRPFSIEVR